MNATALFARFKLWSKKPMAQKLGSVLTRVLRALRPIYDSRILCQSQFVRGLVFDTAVPHSLLISSCRVGTETYLVSASDKHIGRSVYVTRQPYDFMKLPLVVGLLGPSHKRRLLIDVGANIGTICIPAVGREIFQRAVAIEPEPLNYSLLVANIYLNRLNDRITTHNVAFGEKDGASLIFELSASNYGDHRIRRANNTGLYNEDLRETISVRSEKFDKLLIGIDATEALIWIDTQGFEGSVLSGANNALKIQTPLCLEFWPYGMARSDCYQQLKQSLINNGYKAFYNLNEPTITSRPVNSKALDDLYETLERDSGYTDLLVI